MAELARGSVGDRPWGRTLAALGLRAVSGQLTLLSDGKHFLVAFEQGAVVAAASPLASDAAVRVALTSHLVSSSQVPEISRRQAAAPERDEIDVIAELARLGPDHALRLRRRVIAQRAARTFSINHGDFLVTDDTELHVMPGCELDIRAIIYMGARANLPEQRLASELDQLGGWFRLKPAIDDDLPQFGFTDLEQPVVERLRDGGTLAELEDFATSFVDARTVRAVVYALAAYNACEVGPAPPGAQPRRAEASSPGLVATQPMPRITAPGAPLAHSVPRPFTQPIPRTVTPGAAPGRTVTPGERPRTMTPGDRPRTGEAEDRPRTGAAEDRSRTGAAEDRPRTVTPGDRGRGATPGGSARTVTPGDRPRTTTPPPSAGARSTGALPTEPLAAPMGDVALARAATSLQQTEPMTTFPDDALPGESAEARRVRRASTPEPLAARFDPPTQRDPMELAGAEPVASRESPRPRKLSELAAPRDGSSPGLSRPLEPPRDRITPNLERAVDAGRRERGSPGLSRPLDERGPVPTLRFATDDGGAGSNPASHYAGDPPARPGSTPRLRDDGSDPRDGSGRRPLVARGDVADPRDGSGRRPRQRDDVADPRDGSGRRQRDDVADPRDGSGRRPPDAGHAGDAWTLDGSRDSSADAQDLVYPLALETPTHRDLAALGYSVDDDVAAQISSPPPVLDDAWRGGSNPALRPAGDDSRRGGSNPALRPPADDSRRGGSNPALRPPADDSRRGGSNPALRPPADDSRRSGSNPALRPLPAEAAPAEASSGPPGAGLLIRRVTSSRPPVARQVARTDTAQSHQVKAVIAQRLTLLDKGADHFQLIGVAQDASPDALRKAYFALARQLHPDRLAALGISDDGKHAQRLFAQINAGFAILSDPARREPYVSILRRGGEAAIRAEQAKAEQLARQIVEAEDAYHRGELALRRDQPQAAVVELERAVQLNPEEADYHALLAWSRFCAAPDKMSVAAQTRSALEKSLQRSPRAVAPRFFLGRVERMLGHDQDALRHFREVLEHEPHHPEAAAELRVIESRLSNTRKR